jgi:hypothetical protein
VLLHPVSLCSFLDVTDQVSHHAKKGEIILLKYILSFTSKVKTGKRCEAESIIPDLISS